MKDNTNHKESTLLPVVATDFEFDLLRASIFIPDVHLSANLIHRKLPDHWFEFFDAEPTLIPVPDTAPLSIPILQLNSKSGEYRFGVSRLRVDFEIKARSTDEPITSIDDRFKQAVDFIIEFVRAFETPVIRLATNANRFAKHEDPGIYLAAHFCQKRWIDPSPLNSPKQFELSAHKRFDLYKDIDDLDELNVNSWVRNKTGMSLSTKEPLILVEQDINTLPEEVDTRRFSEKDIRVFFGKTLQELDNILALYYPINGSK